MKFTGIAACLSLVALMTVPLTAMPQKSQIELTPHRAIYDLSLSNADASSNVSDMQGRLVFDFSGSHCAGYTYKSRLVTQMTDQSGGAYISDMRTSTWEDSSGENFRFENLEFNGFQESSTVSGQASRKDESDKIAVEFEKPSRDTMEFNQKALFPTQHSIAILEAAERGENILQADIYDGSEQGNKLYRTTTFIGRPVEPSASGELLDDIPNSGPLKALKSWPVSISYFEMTKPGSRSEGLPTYELSFRMFENGVSGDLSINYGDFLIGGKLRQIDFKAPVNCPDGKK